MKDKPDGFEDKAVAPAANKVRRQPKPKTEPVADAETWVKPNRRGWVEDAAPASGPVMAASAQDSIMKVEIRMRSGRQWALGTGATRRVLRPGERVWLDVTTAATIVDAGYANYMEG